MSVKGVLVYTHWNSNFKKVFVFVGDEPISNTPSNQMYSGGIQCGDEYEGPPEHANQIINFSCTDQNLFGRYVIIQRNSRLDGGNNLSLKEAVILF